MKATMPMPPKRRNDTSPKGSSLPVPREIDPPPLRPNPALFMPQGNQISLRRLRYGQR